MRQSPSRSEKISRLILLLAALWLAGCQSGNFRRLEGEWTTRDAQGQETRLVFGPGARFRAIDAKGQKADGTYWEDFRQKPPWLDLKFSDGSFVQTLVRIQDETIEIQKNPPNEPRPKDFSSDAIVYTKAPPIILTPTPGSKAKR